MKTVLFLCDFVLFLYHIYTCFYLQLLLYFNISTNVIIDFNFYPRINNKHSGERRHTFSGISTNISGNVTKHSAECCQTFWEMLRYITGNVLKHCRECRQTFSQCCQRFWGISSNILGNVAKLLSLTSECFAVHYVLISSNQNEYLYSFSVCKNVLLANPKETF